MPRVPHDTAVCCVGSVDGAMQRLVDLLNNGEVETKLEAAWCLNNIASGTEAHAMAVLNNAGDILIGMLSSGNVPLEVYASTVYLCLQSF